MDGNFFDTSEMNALLNQLNETTLKKASDEMADESMTKEMEASQKRFEEILKKHNENNQK